MDEIKEKPPYDIIAIRPLIINVAGAYEAYPEKTSAGAEPTPAARRP